MSLYKVLYDPETNTDIHYHSLEDYLFQTETFQNVLSEINQTKND
jgi:hypothetical protein